MVGVALFLLTLLLAAPAYAGCCQLTRTDAETPTGTVRACEPDASGGCGTVLFEGVLALGDTQSVCTAGITLVYQEFDTTAGAYGPPTQAVCDGTEVQL